MKESIYLIEVKRARGKKWARLSQERFYATKDIPTKLTEQVNSSNLGFSYRVVEYIWKGVVKRPSRTRRLSERSISRQ